MNVKKVPDVVYLLDVYVSHICIGLLPQGISHDDECCIRLKFLKNAPFELRKKRESLTELVQDLSVDAKSCLFSLPEGAAQSMEEIKLNLSIFKISKLGVKSWVANTKVSLKKHFDFLEERKSMQPATKLYPLGEYKEELCEFYNEERAYKGSLKLFLRLTSIGRTKITYYYVYSVIKSFLMVGEDFDSAIFCQKLNEESNDNEAYCEVDCSCNNSDSTPSIGPICQSLLDVNRMGSLANSTSDEQLVSSTTSDESLEDSNNHSMAMLFDTPTGHYSYDEEYFMQKNDHSQIKRTEYCFSVCIYNIGEQLAKEMKYFRGGWETSLEFSSSCGMLYQGLIGIPPNDYYTPDSIDESYNYLVDRSVRIEHANTSYINLLEHQAGDEYEVISLLNNADEDFIVAMMEHLQQFIDHL